MRRKVEVGKKSGRKKSDLTFAKGPECLLARK